MSVWVAHCGSGWCRDGWVCANYDPARFVSNLISSRGRCGGWVCVEFIRFVSSATWLLVGSSGCGPWVWCGLLSWIDLSKGVRRWCVVLSFRNWVLIFHFRFFKKKFLDYSDWTESYPIQIKSDQITKISSDWILKQIQIRSEQIRIELD